MFVIACFLFAVVPSCLLYEQGQGRRDLMSLRMSGACALGVGAEFVIMLVALYTLRFHGPGG